MEFCIACSQIYDYGKSPSLMGESTISGHFFRSYVNLPEGTKIPTGLLVPSTTLSRRRYICRIGLSVPFQATDPSRQSKQQSNRAHLEREGVGCSKGCIIKLYVEKSRQKSIWTECDRVYYKLLLITIYMYELDHDSKVLFSRGQALSNSKNDDGQCCKVRGYLKFPMYETLILQHTSWHMMQVSWLQVSIHRYPVPSLIGIISLVYESLLHRFVSKGFSKIKQPFCRVLNIVYLVGG